MSYFGFGNNRPKRKMSGPVTSCPSMDRATTSIALTSRSGVDPSVPSPVMSDSDSSELDDQVIPIAMEVPVKTCPSSLLVSFTMGSTTPKVLDVLEVLGFVGWIAAILLIVFLGILLWVLFFQFIVRPIDYIEKMKWASIWTVMTGATLYFRAIIRKTAPEMIRHMADHAEIFILMSLIMVFGTNTAFYLHVPAVEPLRDVGFAMISEQPLHSKWRAVSDIMTIALPIVCALQSAFMSRKNRCLVFCSFFRLMTICYFLRTLTVPLTSLPGPAPHCRYGSLNYQPPENWIDIVSRVGPMHGKFNTCGDLLFSGHMCYTNSALLLYLRQLDRFHKHSFYSRLRWILGIGYLMTVAYLCIAGRKHYTVDIVLGIIISTLVYFHFEHGWIPSSWSQLDPPVLSKNEYTPIASTESTESFCTCICTSSEPKCPQHDTFKIPSQEFVC